VLAFPDLVRVAVAELPAVHDLRCSAVRNLERAGVSRSAAMKLTGHKTESVYRRSTIVAENDLREAGAKLNALSDNSGGISVTAHEGRHRSPRRVVNRPP